MKSGESKAYPQAKGAHTAIGIPVFAALSEVHYYCESGPPTVTP